MTERTFKLFKLFLAASLLLFCVTYPVLFWVVIAAVIYRLHKTGAFKRIEDGEF